MLTWDVFPELKTTPRLLNTSHQNYKSPIIPSTKKISLAVTKTACKLHIWIAIPSQLSTAMLAQLHMCFSHSCNREVTVQFSTVVKHWKLKRTTSKKKLPIFNKCLEDPMLLFFAINRPFLFFLTLSSSFLFPLRLCWRWLWDGACWTSAPTLASLR